MLYNHKELIVSLEKGEFDNQLHWLYPGSFDGQSRRYADAIRSLESSLGITGKVALFSAPGRSEVGGNHTDHQHGCVLAAAVTMDMLAAVAPHDRGEISITSDGYPTATVSLDSLAARKDEEGTSIGIIRGVAAEFVNRGYKVGGFDAAMSSQVPKGSGLSSSAAYEVMVGTILSKLYNDNKVTPVEIAQIGQYSEVHYFGKPCGLMDQTASSVGGFVAIDFADPAQPVVRQVDCDLAAHGYTICIVNAGGSHADLTPEYAAIPTEMKQVAAQFGKQVLNEVFPADFENAIPTLRGKVSDRAIMRAIHFFDETSRARRQAGHLERGEIDSFLRLILQSGESSERLLQNIYPTNDGDERSVALALILTQTQLYGKGAWRVHGGGFAGTIQAFVPNDMVDEYCSYMEQAFGSDSCYRLAVRPVGGYCLTK